MTNRKETSEERRERLRLEESKNNPSGSLNDSFNRANNGMPGENGMGWKEIGISILILVIGYIIYKMFF